MTAFRDFIFLLPFLSGCSTSASCTVLGIEGVYQLNHNQINYTLHLSPNRAGSLKIMQNTVGSLDWSLMSVSTQQTLELDSSGAVFHALSKLTDFANLEKGSSVMNSGMIGVSPECDANGQMISFIINNNANLAFVR